MPKYSKRVREEAALICAIAASTPRFMAIFRDVAIAIGLPVPCPALTLACQAWWSSEVGRAPHESRAAATEALIRTGWEP